MWLYALAQPTERRARTALNRGSAQLMKKTPAVLVAAAVIALAPAVSASALSAPSCAGVGAASYATSGIVTADAAVARPGATVVVTWQSGYFAADTPVTVDTAGSADATPTLSVSNTSATTTLDTRSAADGGLEVNVFVPRDSSAGDLVVSAASDTGCGGVTVEVVTDDISSPVPAASAVDGTAGTPAGTATIVGTGALSLGAVAALLELARRRRWLRRPF